MGHADVNKRLSGKQLVKDSDGHYFLYTADTSQDTERNDALPLALSRILNVDRTIFPGTSQSPMEYR